ncbi:hypothetical protein [Escherichia coli]|uniref:hypothetical protein n=1 Tax=Escherichia coli TaxID=562 RepID=UPI0023ED8B61|nr:hypothetical protein [Escherichia coli]
MSRNQRYQCTYSRCIAFFKNGKIYEVGAALVDAKNQEYIHAITDDQGQLWRFYKMGCGTALNPFPDVEVELIGAELVAEYKMTEGVTGGIDIERIK